MKIALLGYGQMGRAIEPLARAAGHDILLKIDSGNRADLTRKQLAEADVAIEFTHPEQAVGNLRFCLECGVPVVCGTTGWYGEYDSVSMQFEKEGGALLTATNFSIGVNLFFAANRYLAQLMARYPDYRADIHEVHHTRKRDAPSGTAITTAEGILPHHPAYRAWYKGSTEQPDLLPVTSDRIDDVPGTHIVTYRSAIDDISLAHTAHSREGFAKGALLAAEWLVGKRGVYTIQDVLGV